jgi:phosphomannomutase
MVVALRKQGRTVLDALDALAREHGVHSTAAVARTVNDADEAAAVMTRLRSNTPKKLCGFDITMTDLAAVRPYERRTNAVILEGGDADTMVRVAVRPSGTEPKVKSYIEVRQNCADGDLDAARAEAKRLQDELAKAATKW